MSDIYCRQKALGALAVAVARKAEPFGMTKDAGGVFRTTQDIRRSLRSLG